VPRRHDASPASLLDVRTLRRVGPRAVGSRAARRVWGRRDWFVLRVELDGRPDVRPGRVAVEMAERDPDSFTGFREALAGARGDDLLELRWRTQWCLDGVRDLYVASDGDGAPLYAQWLIGPERQAHAYGHHLAGTLPLGADERIVEAAYTFAHARGLGAMRAGMAQLLDTARDQGARRVWTHVTVDNVPSLRGCAALGFVPDHVRHDVHRLGRVSVVRRPVSGQLLDHWRRVTG